MSTSTLSTPAHNGSSASLEPATLESITRSVAARQDVPAVGVTISSHELSRLTGVDRERLRTWERRYGFPMPVRNRNGVRRYQTDDVRLVAAISQLAGQGVPLKEVIAEVLAQRDEQMSLASLGWALDHAPTPAIAVSGPEPMRVVWANGASSKYPDSLQPGVELLEGVPAFGEVARAQLRDVLNQPVSDPILVTHTSWIGTFPVAVQSLVWRLEHGAANEPVVVLLQLPTAQASPTASSGSGTGLGTGAQQRAAGWATGTAKARRELQSHDGLASVQRGLALLAGSVAATDGFLCLCSQGSVRVASSIRGATGGRIVPQANCPDLVQALTDSEVDWLSAPSVKRLGLDPSLSAAAIPLVAGRERLGVAVLTFRGEIALDDVARELLLGFGAMTAAALVRERDQRRLRSHSDGAGA